VGTGIGQILDKYELIEKVGQGGMAIVYRGLDTTLRREVAVKVLHRHLADSSEARNRFEREAQAVAKLRHENILEIFDFSSGDDTAAESYIVTEFIDGQTLKQFITDHEIKYPEIGAMITVQVCRALSHAHSLGVLHRDVKPENIMIRTDGVVKLTDFGIAQMLDHHRLTVTGQLLGSPAYMSPEHIEGGQLDFRTDVFAAGIVLYQLACGELPFRGKNPHEILKRIAECAYTDPRQMNPLVGNELAAVIKKSLARDKDDRYPDVTQMMAALEQYLTGSGITDLRGELGRFFNAPVAYEMALRPRLVSTLAARGREKLKEDRNAALDLFNRVLTIDPDNAEVLGEIDRMSRQRRWLRTSLLVGGIALLGGVALAGRHYLATRDADRLLAESAPLDAATAEPAATLDAAPTASAAPPFDAGTKSTPPPNKIDAGHKRPQPLDRTPDAATPDKPVESKRRFDITVFPQNGAEYSIDGGSWTKIIGSKASIDVGPGNVDVTVRRESNLPRKYTIRSDQTGGPLPIFELPFAPGKVNLVCPGGSVMVNKVGETLGERSISVDQNNGTRRLRVEFTNADGTKYDKRDVTVEAGKTTEVKCEL
jgi:serine/threonine-protein kinase